MSPGRALEPQRNRRAIRWVGALLLLSGRGFYARIAHTPERWIFVANFADATVSVITTDGSPGDLVLTRDGVSLVMKPLPSRRDPGYPSRGGSHG